MQDNTPKRKVQAVEKIEIPKGALVNLTRLGNLHAEVVWMAKEPTPGIIKLDKERYVVIKTGEVREFKQNDEKMNESLRATFRRIEHLIKANFDMEENREYALHLTLTYRENMQDKDRLMKDFDIFFKRLQRDKKGHKLEYIAVCEPQERGAWHIHLLLESNRKLYKHYKTEEKMKAQLEAIGAVYNKHWARDFDGYIHAEELRGDDAGSYFSAYFTSLDVEINAPEDPDAVYITDKDGKKHKKGARLHFYPKHFKFYRCSRGIIRPSPEIALHGNVTHEYGKARKINTYAITQTPSPTTEDPEPAEKPLNTIQREAYKKGSQRNEPR